jgi:hypothetical protein
MNFFIGPFRRLDGGRVRREIDEELQLHIDLLTAEHCRENIPWEQAQAEAMKRFGNVEQIRDECVKIARRNQPVVLGLKWFFACVFLFGILVRLFSTDYHVTRIGDLLMEVGVDPASASAPFVATLVDVTGLIIYFTIASIIMRGTLL